MATLVAVFCVTLFWMTAAQPAVNRPVYTINQAISQAQMAPVMHTLKQDLRELKSIWPDKEIKYLIRRYLLNDAQFQAVVRTINSHDAFLAVRRWRSQPEIIGFHLWLRNELRLSGDFSSEEDSVEVHIFNKSPYWADSVNGWQGFVNEWSALLPNPTICNFIDLKMQEGGSFAELKNRITNLEVVYNRFITFPETQRVIAQLKLQGVDVKQLDNLIRINLGWTTAAEASATSIKPILV